MPIWTAKWHFRAKIDVLWAVLGCSGLLLHALGRDLTFCSRFPFLASQVYKRALFGSFWALKSSSKARLVSICFLEPFWDPFWLILAPLLEPFLCHFGALTMILALLCRDTVFGRFLVTVDTVKPSKNIGFLWLLMIFAMSIDASLEPLKSPKWLQKVSQNGPKSVPKWYRKVC